MVYISLVKAQTKFYNEIKEVLYMTSYRRAHCGEEMKPIESNTGVKRNE